MPLKHHDPFTSSADRLREGVNPYVARLRDEVARGQWPVAFGETLRDLPGRWREHLGQFHNLDRPPQKLVLEIGCHKGLTLTTMAEALPHLGLIGLDITFKRVVTTAERLSSRGLKNAFSVMANARGLDRLFHEGELDAVVIFFPDPWSKKARQAKNRLLNPDFAKSLRRVLGPQGLVWLKTDQKAYFDEATQALEAEGFVQAPHWEGHLIPQDFTSAFEMRFASQGVPSYGARWIRP